MRTRWEKQQVAWRVADETNPNAVWWLWVLMAQTLGMGYSGA